MDGGVHLKPTLMEHTQGKKIPGEKDPMVVCILLIAPFVLGIFTRQTWKFVIELMGSFVFFISFGGCPNSDLQILLFSSVECS